LGRSATGGKPVFRIIVTYLLTDDVQCVLVGYISRNGCFPSLLAIRKGCTIASYKLMCWRVGRGSRLASSDATSVVLVEGPSLF
jgi:hypothetical protein